MYNKGSTAFNNLIEKSGGQSLKARLVFKNFTIEDVIKLEYYGGSNNSDDIAIGTTAMSYLDVEIITDKIITNEEFLLEAGFLINDEYEYAPIGYYTVQLPENEEETVSFKAYDRMQKFEKPYTSNLTFPTTDSEVIAEICLKCNIELATPIVKPIAISEIPQGYTCREVLGYIAGIHGFFACIDRYGKLNLRWYEETPVEKPVSLIWSISKSQSNHTVGKIVMAKDSETTYTSGSGTININTSNPFATQEIADNVYKALNGYTYRPVSISMLDDIRLDPWDTIKVTYFDGNTYNIPVMTLEHSFSNCETKIEAVGKSDIENEYTYKGPIVTALERTSTELLIANRVIATKVDAEWVRANTITADKLEATNARVGVLEANSLTAATADLRYANITFGNIDVANINKANIGSLFAKVGLLTSATIQNGHVTGYLDSVEVNANSITAGTLITDRLVFRGQEKSIVYELNNITGALQTVQSDTLNGEILTDRSITVDKIVAKSITANEIATATLTANELNVADIFGNSAVLSTLTSQSAFINAISTNSVVVGASNNAVNALNAVNGMEIGGRNILLNSSLKTNYEKWELQVNGETAEITTKYNKKCAHIKSTALKRNGLFKQSIIGKLEPNTQYTMSGWTLTENITKGSTNFAIMFYQDGYYPVNNTSTWFGYGSKNFAINSGVGAWNYISWTFVTDSKVEAATYLNIYVYTRDFIGDVYFYDLKLEKGNKATDWSPAPEDISVDNIYKENTTLIDGGKIYTGTVTADKITANSLSAISANLGTVKIGGSGNGNGTLEVYDANNKLLIKGDNTGLATTKMINVDDSSQYIVFSKTAFNYGGQGYAINGIDVGGLTLGEGGSIYDEVLNDGGYIGNLSKIFAGKSFDIFMGSSRYNLKTILSGYYGTPDNGGIAPVKAKFYGDVSGEEISGETIEGGVVKTASGANLDDVNSRLKNLTFYADTTTTPSATGSYYAVRTLPSGFTPSNTYIITIMIQRADNSAWQVVDGQISAYIADTHLYIYVSDSFWAGRPIKILFARR